MWEVFGISKEVYFAILVCLIMGAGVVLILASMHLSGKQHKKSKPSNVANCTQDNCTGIGLFQKTIYWDNYTYDRYICEHSHVFYICRSERGRIR